MSDLAAEAQQPGRGENVPDSSSPWSLMKLVAGQSAEALDPRGRTLLHLAVSLGHLESARVLLRHKADVTKENGQGWTGKYPY
ncbi:hypothetical protein U0070_016894 [Myodes glareolus]|uniref:Uncharacterized protein n=1 Tax=Myodes glareolus TaxID=447135 RepID=A0AAW0IC35_MYOGA